LGALIASLGGFVGHVDAGKAAAPPAANQHFQGLQVLRPSDPHARGLTEADLNSLCAILRKAVDDRTVPGVSLLLAHEGEVIFKEASDRRFLMARVALSWPVGACLQRSNFAAFYQMHANGGTFHGRRILSEQAIATMHTRQAKLELLMAGPYGNDYGLAFFLDRLDDKGHAGHSKTH
jgi:hypothetical protein